MSEAEDPESTAEREGIVDQQDAVIERMERLEGTESDADAPEDAPPRE